MKQRNNYFILGSLIVLYFLLEFIINFIIIKLLGGYDNKIDYNLCVIYSRLIIIFVSIIVLILNKKGLDYFRFKPITLWKLFVIILGSILYSLIIIFIRNTNITEYAFHWTQNDNNYLISAIVMGSIYEEIFEKGIPIEYLIKKKVSPIFIVILVSLLFSISHLPSFVQVFYAFGLGLITSFIYIKERNLIYTILFHFIYNFMVLCIY